MTVSNPASIRKLINSRLYILLFNNFWNVSFSNNLVVIRLIIMLVSNIYIDKKKRKRERGKRKTEKERKIHFKDT
jgi:hypothetical protein